MSETESLILLEIPEYMKGERLDKALAKLMPEHTRSAIQGWIGEDLVRIGGSPVSQKHRLTGNESIEVCIPERESLESQPENIPLDVVFEDDQILVLNKPAGLVVHPGAGNPGGTLLNGLLYHLPELAALPRAGIVHRLDKDTTGLMVVARTETSRQHLIAQLDARSMKRQYLAIVEGIMISGETIDQPIGRNRNDRLKMCVTSAGKPAVTHFRVVQKFRAHSLVQASLETGRTHQIRVHLAWRGYSIVGDSTYGNRNRIPPSAEAGLITSLQTFSRQALHAEKLTLTHPRDNQEMSWHAELPDDMQTLLGQLEKDASANTN